MKKLAVRPFTFVLLIGFLIISAAIVTGCAPRYGCYYATASFTKQVGQPHYEVCLTN